MRAWAASRSSCWRCSPRWNAPSPPSGPPTPAPSPRPTAASPAAPSPIPPTRSNTPGCCAARARATARSARKTASRRPRFTGTSPRPNPPPPASRLQASRVPSCLLVTVRSAAGPGPATLPSADRGRMRSTRGRCGTARSPGSGRSGRTRRPPAAAATSSSGTRKTSLGPRCSQRRPKSGWATGKPAGIQPPGRPAAIAGQGAARRRRRLRAPPPRGDARLPGRPAARRRRLEAAPDPRREGRPHLAGHRPRRHGHWDRPPLLGRGTLLVRIPRRPPPRSTTTPSPSPRPRPASGTWPPGTARKSPGGRRLRCRPRARPRHARARRGSAWNAAECLRRKELR